MHRTHTSPRVRRHRRRVERRVLDVVAHVDDVLLAERLHVHEGTAAVEPEFAVVGVDHPVPEVHELRRRADVQLHALEDRLDVRAFEPEQALHPARVDRARAHPLVDRNLGHAVRAEQRDDVAHPRAVDQVSAEQVLADERRERGAVEVVERGRHQLPFSRGETPRAPPAVSFSTIALSFAPRGQPA
jgi:hypothetical protein